MDFELWRRCRDEDTMVMKGGGVEAWGLTPGSGVQWAEDSYSRHCKGRVTGGQEQSEWTHITVGRDSETVRWGGGVRGTTEGEWPGLDLKSEGHSFLS